MNSNVAKTLNGEHVFKLSDYVDISKLNHQQYSEYMVIVSSWNQAEGWEACFVPVDDETIVELKDNECFEVVGKLNCGNWDTCSRFTSWTEADSFIGRLIN